MLRCFLFSIFLLIGAALAEAQEVAVPEQPYVNVDSIILDSMRKAYILNHKPLSEKEILHFSAKGNSRVYGEFIAPLIDRSMIYNMKGKPSPVYAQG